MKSIGAVTVSVPDVWQLATVVVYRVPVQSAPQEAVWLATPRKADSTTPTMRVLGKHWAGDDLASIIRHVRIEFPPCPAQNVREQGRTRLDDHRFRGPKLRQLLGISGEEQPERSRSPHSNSRPSARSLPPICAECTRSISPRPLLKCLEAATRRGGAVASRAIRAMPRAPARGALIFFQRPGVPQPGASAGQALPGVLADLAPKLRCGRRRRCLSDSNRFVLSVIDLSRRTSHQGGSGGRVCRSWAYGSAGPRESGWADLADWGGTCV